MRLETWAKTRVSSCIILYGHTQINLSLSLSVRITQRYGYTKLGETNLGCQLAASDLAFSTPSIEIPRSAPSEADQRRLFKDNRNIRDAL